MLAEQLRPGSLTPPEAPLMDSAVSIVLAPLVVRRRGLNKHDVMLMLTASMTKQLVSVSGGVKVENKRRIPLHASSPSYSPALA